MADDVDYKGYDPIWVAKKARGVEQELRDRTDWPKVEPEEAVKDEDAKAEKPSRGRPAKPVVESGKGAEAAAGSPQVESKPAA